MFAYAAQPLGYRVCVLDPIPDSPAGRAADRHLLAAYDDAAALVELAQLCAAVTTEFENVPAASLEQLAQRRPVRPSAGAVAIAQDRLREKAFLRSCGAEVAPHAAVVAAAQVPAIDAGLFPGILKTARLGYDGKGQLAVADPGRLAGAWQALQAAPCVLEKRLPLRRELSVIVARGSDGAMASFPVCENEHRHGILARTWLPARIGPDLAQAAQALGARIAAGLEYVGVLCVELFELADGRLLVNEIAPRPHNSGHATIDACVSSQFEQQVRTLAGLPLGDPRLLAPAVMLNLLGELWLHGETVREPAWEQVLAVPGACLHLYGKPDPRPGRKMGHVTVLGETLAEAAARAEAVARILGIDTATAGAAG
jgi:5-(carboxyamino)imidazole ribonucleotide synthase